jgi:hypothetical protein
MFETSSFCSVAVSLVRELDLVIERDTEGQHQAHAVIYSKIPPGALSKSAARRLARSASIDFLSKETEDLLRAS